MKTLLFKVKNMETKFVCIIVNMRPAHSLKACRPKLWSTYFKGKGEKAITSTIAVAGFHRLCLIIRIANSICNLNILYLISEMEKYGWYANEKLKGLQLMFLIRDIRVRYPSAASDTLRRNSKLQNMVQTLFHKQIFEVHKTCYDTFFTIHAATYVAKSSDLLRMVWAASRCRLCH